MRIEKFEVETKEELDIPEEQLDIPEEQINTTYNFSSIKGQPTKSFRIDWGAEDVSGYNFALVYKKTGEVVKTLTVGEGLTFLSNSIVGVTSVIEDMDKGLYTFEFKRSIGSDAEVFLTGTKWVK